jgi:hypothetical protein
MSKLQDEMQYQSEILRLERIRESIGNLILFHKITLITFLLVLGYANNVYRGRVHVCIFTLIFVTINTITHMVIRPACAQSR